MAASSSWHSLACACGCKTLSPLSHCLPLWVFVPSSFLPFIKTLVIGFRAHTNLEWSYLKPPPLSYICRDPIANKVTFWGFRWTCLLWGYHLTHSSNVSGMGLPQSCLFQGRSSLAPPCWVTVHHSSNHWGLRKALLTLVQQGSHYNWGRQVGWTPLETLGQSHREGGSFLKAKLRCSSRTRRKGCQEGEPHRCPLHTLWDVSLSTSLPPT